MHYIFQSFSVIKKGYLIDFNGCVSALLLSVGLVMMKKNECKRHRLDSFEIYVVFFSTCGHFFSRHFGVNAVLQQVAFVGT